ncbi:hypothetical protein [Halogranum rubrum]|uniref:Uncharacterized protein n=1 Tax=Halogranum salarium B-1 TaxID=1210908 RepID=J3JDX5_9EURY|nr:hypothetical protein [Halogranum salarium]EJN57869.1 hypothetical protein HSB1_32860 [Halogranum salarium B-1]
MGLFDADESDKDTTDDSAGWGTDERQQHSQQPHQQNQQNGHGGRRDDEANEHPEPTLVAARLRDDQPNGTIKRVVDEEAGVVLYCYKNANAGGMTAVPLSETDLD